MKIEKLLNEIEKIISSTLVINKKQTYNYCE